MVTAGISYVWKDTQICVSCVYKKTSIEMKSFHEKIALLFWLIICHEDGYPCLYCNSSPNSTHWQALKWAHSEQWVWGWRSHWAQAVHMLIVWVCMIIKLLSISHMTHVSFCLFYLTHHPNPTARIKHSNLIKPSEFDLSQWKLVKQPLSSVGEGLLMCAWWILPVLDGDTDDSLRTL